jgi:hypothetical protein
MTPWRPRVTTCPRVIVTLETRAWGAALDGGSDDLNGASGPYWQRPSVGHERGRRIRPPPALGGTGLTMVRL